MRVINSVFKETHMLNHLRLPVTVSVFIVAIPFSAIPVFAGPPSPATTPIDDASGDPNAPGVNVIRKVSDDQVIVRLNRGNRQAHFNVIVRGVEVTDITDDFLFANGVDGGHTDGIWNLGRLRR